MRVYINPTYGSPDRADGGIRRVVEAQQRYLPTFGWEVTTDPRDADLIANHGASLVEVAGVPMVNHNHGMMWHDYGFGEWGDKVNASLIDAMVRANAITAPSQWVAQAISRGMLASPEVVYHGVDCDEWAHNEPTLGYVLWNKARADQVSDPDDMQRVAELLPNVPFVSTFGEQSRNVMLLATMPYEEMRPVVQRAGVYLATARETFGIGTLEALAAGVPIAGWRYGGQEEIVREGETGYLAPYGDYQALAMAITRCLADRERLSRNCVEDARSRWGWEGRIAQYAALYTRVYEAYGADRPAVSVIVTCHNLAQYLGDAIGSVVAQTMTDWECLVVDDASTDESVAVAETIADSDDRIYTLRTPSNLKLSGARNYGFEHANGRYIIFLDADDMLAPNALDQLSAALENDTGIHIAYGHLDTFNDPNPERSRGGWPGEKFNWHGQIAHLNQLPYAAMVRREVFERSGGYRTRDWRAEDASLWTRLTSFGFRAAKVTEESTLIYRFRSDSKSADEARAHEDRDGDWTAWYPWRMAGDPYDGMRVIQEKRQPNPIVVPFGAQGQPPRPLRAWPVHHHQEPLISVIIPVGPGHAQYLIDALDSVQAQTLPFWECIVVNDGPGQLNLTAWPWARSISTYDLDGDGGGMGAGFARNAGLAHARAPLVCFLDADDILVPNALEAMAQAYLDSDGRYIYGDWVHLEDETRLDGPAVLHYTPEYDPQLWLEGAQHAVTCLLPTDDVRAVGGFDENLPAWEDWDLLIKLAIAGVCGQRLAQPLLVYRLESGQRRKVGDAKEAELLAAIRDRYYTYGTGAKQMGSCCGGNAPAIDHAAQVMQMLIAMPLEEMAPAPQENQPIRLEYIGEEWGEQVWFSQDRQRQYKAGRDPSARYVDADPRDWQYLISFGKFARVALPDPTPELVGATGELEPRADIRRQRGRR
jgi:glycosyltransferase involved in cell wall biosynthesis